MPTPMPLPLRVLIKGPSTLLMTSMMSGPRTDLTFPRVMERELLARGRSAEVWNAGALGWPTRDLFKTWDEEVAAWSPDILLLAAGHMETIHLLLPPWIERRANTVHRRVGPFKWLHYKRLAFRALARAILLIQRKVDRPGFTANRRRRRNLADTEAYIKMTSQYATPLILLLEVHHPTQAKIDWFPGWPQRIDAVNAELRKLADRYDNVEVFEITDLMKQFDPGDPEHLWADGIHFSAPFHEAIGKKLAAYAEEWAGQQPHLAQP